MTVKFAPAAKIWLLCLPVFLATAGVARGEDPSANVESAKGAKGDSAGEAGKPAVRADAPATVDEARSQARLLHEAFHGALQVMHRDFFDEDSVEQSLPSQSLDDVFAEMARSHSIEVRWLGVNATKGKNHLPQNRFEEAAIEAFLSGKTEHEAADGSRFRFAGVIRLQNECLKCHVPTRTSLEDRMAGLVISIPYAKP